jgi:putative membrane-bound dehydrogenase-like protein
MINRFLVAATISLGLACGLAYAEDDSIDRDYAAELPRIAPTEPQAALDTFAVQPGFRMELAASEPLLRDPIAMAFDADGRMFVVEMTGYSEERETIPCTIRLLEDTDADGVYDKQTPYVEGLEWAVAVACYDGGVFIGVPPNILYAKDTDGDNRADVVETVYTGFALSNVQGLMNTFLWGPDNRIYGATSASGGSVVPAAQPDAEPISLGGRDFSFDPRTRALRAESGGAQHGATFDAWGRRFVCSNSDHLQWTWYDDRYAAGNPWFTPPAAREGIAADGAAADVFRRSPVEPWREVRTRLRMKGIVPGIVEGGGRAAGYFTSATGVTIYRGDAWPTECYGQVIVGDVGGNLIHRKRIEENGTNLSGVRVDEGVEFISSTDIWFRPVQFANAPDGCLYVADMYREVIEHPDSLPEIIKKHLDLNSGNDRGRIYRIAPEGFTPKAPPRLSQFASADLVPLLAHRNSWHAETAARLLFERQDESVAPTLEAFAKDSPDAQGRMRALYALDGMGALGGGALALALADADPMVRTHALRLAENRMDIYDVRSAALKCAADPNAWVRLQAGWSLAFAPEEDRLPALATLARTDTAEARVRASVLCSAGAASGRLADALAQDAEFTDKTDAGEWMTPLARMAGASGSVGESAAALAAVERLSATHPPLAEGMLLALHESGPLGKSSGGAADMLARLVKEAKATAADESAEPAARAQAVRVLRSADAAKVLPVLLPLVSALAPEEVQAAALDALGGIDHPDVVQTLLSAWSGLSPARRAQAIEIIFRRAASTKALLAALRNGAFRATDLDSTRRHALTNHPDEDIRAEAVGLLGMAQPSSRNEIIEQYRKTLDLDGDPARGGLVFAQHCTPCHRVRDQGSDVGPNLATIAQAGAEKILLNVLDPNRELNPQYVNYTIETADFETHTGIIAAETATTITLKRAHGETDTIPRADIEDIRSEALSIMPEGFESAITPEAMADLIAYLTAE